MFFAKRNRRPRTERATSSESHRRLVYARLKDFIILDQILGKNLEHIYQLIVTLDIPAYRNDLEYFVVFNDLKSLKRLQGKFPFDFDEVDYPSLELFLIKSNEHNYAVIIAESADYGSREIVKIITGVSLNKDNFERRILIYPI